MAGFDYNFVIETILKTVETSNKLCYPLTHDETLNSLIFSRPLKCTRLEVLKVLEELIASNLILSYSGFLFLPPSFTPEMAEHLIETRGKYDATHARAKILLSSKFKYLKKLRNVKFIGIVQSPFPESIVSVDIVIFTSSNNVWIVKSLAEKFCINRDEYDKKLFLVIEESAFDLRSFNLLDLKKLAFIKPLYEGEPNVHVLSDFYNKNLWIFDHMPFYSLNDLNFKFISKMKKPELLHKPNIVNNSANIINRALFNRFKNQNPESLHTESYYYIWNKGIR